MAKIVRSVGVAIPIGLLEEIDSQRGDIPRSKFLMRIIERGYRSKEVSAK